MKLANKLMKYLYNKISVLIKAKLHHYNTVIKPECLYAEKKEKSRITKNDNKVLRQILGPK